MNIIEVNKLTKIFKTKIKREGLKESIHSLFAPVYKEVLAVDGISFHVSQGEILAFIGPNGAGKSTTIKMLTGILKPTSGRMSVLGMDPFTQREKLAYSIGTVFGQKSQLWLHLPAIDSFKLLGGIYEINKKALQARLDYLKDILEIGDLLETPVRKLSLGQRIRCEIAASLLHKPKIVFLDEPTIGLDVVVKQKIRELILRLNREENVTIFLTSHDAGDIESICQRAIIVNHGRIVLDQSIKNLKYNYMNKKIIDVRFHHPVTLNVPGATVVKCKDCSAKLEVDTAAADIGQVASHLFRLGKVADITISDEALENIIADIYRKQAEGAG